jgi:hypothetical protein
VFECIWSQRSVSELCNSRKHFDELDNKFAAFVRFPRVDNEQHFNESWISKEFSLDFRSIMLGKSLKFTKQVELVGPGQFEYSSELVFQNVTGLANGVVFGSNWTIANEVKKKKIKNFL